MNLCEYDRPIFPYTCFEDKFEQSVVETERNMA